MAHGDLKEMAVIYDNEQRNGYCSGEVVSGQVLLKLSAATKVNDIHVLVKGYAQVCWTDRLSNCSEERKHLSLSKTILAATGTQDLILDCGIHVIPFQLELPQSPLVSSFTGKYGRVYYMVQAVLKRPFHEKQHACRELSIISHIDVNMPSLISSKSQTCEKMIGCWIFTSGLISLTVNVDRIGYCSGELIPIYARIENRSSRLVVPKAVIYQIQTCMANGKMKIVKQVVANVRGNVVPSDSSDRWNGKTLKIPPVSPSILNSDILRVEYILEVSDY
ncbi:arrestin domain-containing protein 4-like [Xyrauchen texanus]|uniref:arrestin domain-containing protein 4-like n=1 Tax=Xyrauchen texanus TaxID=154827 RepID=UPI002241D4C6|nr:arrestin domain-containing protein 4-like [Xyrauchen texanus]